MPFIEKSVQNKVSKPPKQTIAIHDHYGGENCEDPPIKHDVYIEGEIPIKRSAKKEVLPLIETKEADHFAQYVKGLNRETHINPLVKRITYKDGKTRIGVIYEFVQLWNEFVSQRK